MIAGRAAVIAHGAQAPADARAEGGGGWLVAVEVTLRAYAEGRAERDVASVAALAQPLAVVEGAREVHCGRHFE